LLCLDLIDIRHLSPHTTRLLPIIFNRQQVLCAFNTLERRIAGCLRDCSLPLPSANRHISVDRSLVNARHGGVILCELFLLLMTWQCSAHWMADAGAALNS